MVRELSDGQSKLRVRNETDLDTVVVLSSPEEPEIALLAVYIQSDDTYTVTQIPRSTCIMDVTFGKDWDEDSQKFLTNATYVQLDNEFDFAQSKYTYTKFTVTFSGKNGEPIQSQVIRRRIDRGQPKSGESGDGCGCS